MQNFRNKQERKKRERERERERFIFAVMEFKQYNVKTKVHWYRKTENRKQ